MEAVGPAVWLPATVANMRGFHVTGSPECLRDLIAAAN